MMRDKNDELKTHQAEHAGAAVMLQVMVRLQTRQLTRRQRYKLLEPRIFALSLVMKTTW